MTTENNTINQTVLDASAEQMNIVIVGHVDHGKSSLIGRLLADTHSLPEGKLDQVKAVCKANAKPFEYAFLLDALKDEQDQGITIDMARCFFKTSKRHYIIIDAPGHIEFLKNMITGAARAEAAMLLIDAAEGVQENSKRHGYLLAMLGIKQVVVVVNKMDLVNYDESRYKAIVEEYSAFLKEINLEPKRFIPISAMQGDNLVTHSSNTPWYTESTVLEAIDEFEKEADTVDKAFRFPVQGVYKFTEENDDRRIVSGTVETGKISVGDPVVFYPSYKKSSIKSIEGFNLPSQTSIQAGYATGFTLNTQIYIKPGELMCIDKQQQPRVGSSFKCHIFWLGKTPMVKDKKYKIKIASTRASVYLNDVINVMDAAELVKDTKKKEVSRHDVAECILQTLKPIPFDLSHEMAGTSRFVIIDQYEIAGGGIITDCLHEEETLVDAYIKQRELVWDRSEIRQEERIAKIGHPAKAIILTGPKEEDRTTIARALEKSLFDEGKQVYYLGISNLLTGLTSTIGNKIEDREKHLKKLGEIAHLFTQSGQLFISTIPELDDAEIKVIKAICGEDNISFINLGQAQFKEEVALLDPQDETLIDKIKSFI